MAGLLVGVQAVKHYNVGFDQAIIWERMGGKGLISQEMDCAYEHKRKFVLWILPPCN